MTFLPSLHPVLVPAWPKLAWVLRLDHEGYGTVFHGPAVEVRPDWVFEGVWDGDFESGDFDHAELVFGSGVRLRGSHLVCVGSSTTLDRLWHHENREGNWVSNTLPGLLAVCGGSLDENYTRYRPDIETVVLGYRRYQRRIPIVGGSIEAIYFDNLKLGLRTTARVEKPNLAQDWGSFEEYRDYLATSASRIGSNACAPNRRIAIEVIATVSSGYDSTASAVLAREAGATSAFTLLRARSLLPRSDSGVQIAHALGLVASAHVAPGRLSPDEIWFFAPFGWALDFNLSAFPYPSDRLSLLFTGFYGDTFWNIHGEPNSEVVRGDPAGLGLTEYRLLKGIAHCPVPFWGVRRSRAMKLISRSSAMGGWSLGTEYDRPVPRRIAEEAGVPRAAFGLRKSATTIDGHVSWPISRAGDAAFRRYLASREMRAPPVRVARLVNQFDQTILRAIRERTGMSRPRAWMQVREERFLFTWAITELCSLMRGQLNAAYSR